MSLETTNMTDQERRHHARDVMRRWRARRKKRGLCLQCGISLTDLQHVRCPDCRAIVASKMRDRRSRQMLGNITEQTTR